VRILPLVATALGLLGLFALSEIGSRRGLPAETTRRFVHVAGAGATALFPLYLNLGEVVGLAVIFTAFLGWTYVRGSLRSVHAVTRPTLGAVVFPIGLGLVAIAVWSHPAAFSYAALVLALADPAASVVGRRMTGPSWTVPGGRKSVPGSVGFLIVAFALGTTFVAVEGSGMVLAAAGAAVALTAVEAGLGFGLDNLLVPPIAGLLGEYWLRL
jgi:dolichol kinase